jgi:AbrB family looped-hinge helix DNA binding protein
MSTTKVTSKGQITIPKDIRDTLGVKVGDEVEFVENERGVITMRKKLPPRDFHKWKGFLKDLEGRTTDEIMEELRGPPLDVELRGLPPADDPE